MEIWGVNRLTANGERKNGILAEISAKGKLQKRNDISSEFGGYGKGAQKYHGITKFGRADLTSEEQIGHMSIGT